MAWQKPKLELTLHMSGLKQCQPDEVTIKADFHYADKGEELSPIEKRGFIKLSITKLMAELDEEYIKITEWHMKEIDKLKCEKMSLMHEVDTLKDRMQSMLGR